MPSEAIDYSKHHEEFMVIDPLYWAEAIDLIFGGQKFTLERHNYQKDCIQDTAQREVWKFGAQLGKTICQMIKRNHALIYGRYPQALMYIFPTVKTVRRFSQARFTPFITDNPFIAKAIPKTDNLELKRVGKANLYFIGGGVAQKIGDMKKSSALLKSEPADAIVWDEYDEMDMEMVGLAIERLSHSEVQEWAKISTPSIPDFGIDAEYQKTNQMAWLIKCRKCGKYTCLELEFPDCLYESLDGKTVTRLCPKCRDRELFPSDGQWVAQKPDQDDYAVGRWISQLNSMYIDPKTILNGYRDPPDGNISEIYNSKLGMAYIEAENRLTQNDIYNTCCLDPMELGHNGPSAMGVDVHKRELYCVIGHRPNGHQAKINKVCVVADFSDVYDLCRAFNVQCIVLDAGPEHRKVIEFIETLPFEGLGCMYIQAVRTIPNVNGKECTIKINRTDICDATHRLFTVPGRVIVPRRNEALGVYAKQMTNIAKVWQLDEETKVKKYKYRTLGDDHYRHATNYFLLAVQRIGVMSNIIDLKKVRDRWAVEDGESTGSFMGM